MNPPSKVRLAPALLFACAALLLGGAVLVLVALPAWRAPENRTYTSRYGYAAVLRQSGRPFPVETARAERRPVVQSVLGEGMLAARSLLVPVVPIERVLRVHVEEGQTVKAGQVLAELDPSRHEMKLRSAELAVKTAQAELDRVMIGSAYVLAQERPQLDAVRLAADREQEKLLAEQEKTLAALVEQGAAPRLKLLELQGRLSEIRRALSESEIYLGMSTRGRDRSREIAENALAEARNALELRRRELLDCRVLAPEDGVVERVLIQAGEFNQDTGRPAFVLSVGEWFEAHFDQSAISLVREGQSAEIRLEAHPGAVFPARVERVVPVVTYNLGGPETNRPIRPMGTGAPEWPATFVARLRLEPTPGRARVPGLTGFARVESRREGVTVPAAAVLSLSAGYGFVHVLDAGGGRRVAGVACGPVIEGRIEIREGLAEGEEVVVRGHEALDPGDAVVRREGSAP